MRDVESFLQYLEQERRFSAHTIKAYKKDLQQFCAFVHTDFDTFNPTLIHTTDVREWIITLMQEGNTASTVCRKIVALRSFWKFLMMQGRESRNIMRSVTMPKTKKPLPVFYRKEQVNEVLENVQEDDYESVLAHAVINFLYQTGARCSELIELKEANVDLEQKLIKLQGKRNKERTVPFGDDLAETLNRYKTIRQETIHHRQDDTFFLLQSGKKLYRKKAYEIVHNNMSQVCTQSKQSPHVLRHTFATQMLNHGADINAVKSLLGHASLAATQIYTHTTFEEIQSIYKLAHPTAQKKEDL